MYPISGTVVRKLDAALLEQSLEVYVGAQVLLLVQ
jgi:hypothetical protein